MQQTLLQVNYGLPLEANRAYTDVQCSMTALSKVQVLSKKGYLILKIEKGYLCYEIATKTYTDLLMINDSIYGNIFVYYMSGRVPVFMMLCISPYRMHARISFQKKRRMYAGRFF